MYINLTYLSLQFASRAKTISNKPKVNEVLSDAALLKRSRMEIQKLQEKINAVQGHSCFFIYNAYVLRSTCTCIYEDDKPFVNVYTNTTTEYF